MRAGLLFLLCGCRQVLGFDDVRDQPADAPGGLIDTGACATVGPACATGDELDTCTAVGEPPTQVLCTWGCSESGGAHCEELQPTGGAATAADLEDAGLADVTIAGGVIDTDSGSILNVRGVGIGVIDGISFDVRAGVGVFRFNSLHVTGGVIVTGSNAVVLAANEQIVLDGVVAANGCLIGAKPPGGGLGGQNLTAGTGPGGGNTGKAETNGGSGGGGGGHATDGATGGPGLNEPGGAGGIANGTADIPLLRLAGGSGGGSGGPADDGGDGGNGGGAIQLVANVAITIDGAGGINAGGCGGANGRIDGAGGGGGSGGTIVLEAAKVSIAGGIAVNGGGGGGGDSGDKGENGQFSTASARGGLDGGEGGNGGNGAGALIGATPGASARCGGGGGGATGRIRINTRDGTAAVSGFTSPALANGNTGMAVTK